MVFNVNEFLHMIYRVRLVLSEWWFRARYALARNEAKRSRLVMMRVQRHMAALGFPLPPDLDIEEAARRLAGAARAIFIATDWITDSKEN